MTTADLSIVQSAVVKHFYSYKRIFCFHKTENLGGKFKVAHSIFIPTNISSTM